MGEEKSDQRRDADDYGNGYVEKDEADLGPDVKRFTEGRLGRVLNGAHRCAARWSRISRLISAGWVNGLIWPAPFRMVTAGFGSDPASRSTKVRADARVLPPAISKVGAAIFA